MAWTLISENEGLLRLALYDNAASTCASFSLPYDMHHLVTAAPCSLHILMI